MAYPAAVTLRQIVVGPFLDGAGNPITNGQATIVPSRAALWHAQQADQAWMFAVPETRKLDANGMATFSRPVTDQVGWTDGVGGQVTGWTYSVRVNLGRQEQAPPAAVFQLPAAGTALQPTFDGSGLISAGTVSRIDSSQSVTDALIAARLGDGAATRTALDLAVRDKVQDAGSALRFAMAGIWRGTYYAADFDALYALVPTVPIGSIIELGQCTVPGAGTHYHSFWTKITATQVWLSEEPMVVDTFTTLQQIRAHLTGGAYSARLALEAGVSAARITDTNRTLNRWSIESPGQWRPVVDGRQQVLVENRGQLAVAAGTWTTVNFDNDLYDPYDMHSGANDTRRIIIPYDGLYEYGIRYTFQNDVSASQAAGAAMRRWGDNFTFSEEMQFGHLSNHGAILIDRGVFSAGTGFYFQVYSQVANGLAYGSAGTYARAWFHYLGPYPNTIA